MQLTSNKFRTHTENRSQYTCLSIIFAERMCEQKLELSLIKSFSKKLKKNQFCLVVDVAQLDHAQLDHILLLFSSVASRGCGTVSQHMLRAALHIVNIDFELN